MLDALNTKAKLEAYRLPSNVLLKSYEPFIWNGIRFTANQEKNYVADKDSVKANGLGDLFLRFGRGTNANFYLSNSLHKLCYDGLNHTDFTKSQLLDTTSHLCDTLHIGASEFLLQGRIEFSVNIPVNDANGLIEAWYSFKNKKLRDMCHISKGYGKKAILTKYTVKAYNPMLRLKYGEPQLHKALLKNGQIANNNKLLRFEVSILISHVQKVWGIPLKTFKDLENDAILNAIGEQLVKTAKGMRFNSFLPFDTDYRELSKVLFFKHTNKAQFEYFKEHHYKTYQRHERDIKKLLNDHSKPFNIAPLIAEKWQFLLNH